MIQEYDNYDSNQNQELEYNTDEYNLADYIHPKIYNESLNQFKNIDQLAKAYIDQNKNYTNIRAAYDSKNKSLNEEQREILAKEFSNTIYGIPKDKYEYEISTPLEIENEIDKASYEDGLKEAAHYLGISKANGNQFREVFEEYSTYIVDEIAALEENQVKQEIEKSREYFGTEISTVVNTIDNFFDRILINSPMKNSVYELKQALYDTGALANKAVMELIYNIASMYKESPIRNTPGRSSTYSSGNSRSDRATIIDRSDT